MFEGKRWTAVTVISSRGGNIKRTEMPILVKLGLRNKEYLRETGT